LGKAIENVAAQLAGSLTEKKKGSGARDLKPALQQA
jgi:hypothetical protein